MSISASISPLSVLRSGLDGINKAIKNESTNITMAGQSSYVKTTINFTEQQIAGTCVGLATTNPMQIVDEHLMADLRKEHGLAGYFETLSTYGKRAELLLGTRQGENGLFEVLSQFISKLKDAQNNPGNLGVQETAFSSLETHIGQLKSMDRQLSTLRNEQDQQILNTVNQVNTLLGQVLEVSNQLQSTNTTDQHALVNERRQLLHDLNALVDIDVFYNDKGQIFVGCGDASLLTLDGQVHPMGYTPTPVVNSDTTFSALTIGTSTKDVGDGIKKWSHGGILKAQLELRDTWQQGLQQQLQEYGGQFFNQLKTALPDLVEQTLLPSGVMDTSVQGLAITTAAAGERGGFFTKNLMKLSDAVIALQQTPVIFGATKASAQTTTSLGGYATFMLSKTLEIQKQWVSNDEAQKIQYNSLSGTIKNISGVNIEEAKLSLEEMRSWYNMIMDALKIQLQLLNKLSELMMR